MAQAVSTLSRDLAIGRTDTTTLYHVTAMFWYHVKHQLLLNKMQSFLWRNKLPWQQESLAKTTYILALVGHIWKTNSVTPISYCTKMISTPRWKILWSGFRATLTLQLFKVALNPLHRIFVNFAERFILVCWLHFRNKKWGSPTSFLRYEQLKPKYGVFLQGFPVTTVTFYVTKMTESF